MEGCSGVQEVVPDSNTIRIRSDNSRGLTCPEGYKDPSLCVIELVTEKVSDRTVCRREDWGHEVSESGCGSGAVVLRL